MSKSDSISIFLCPQTSFLWLKPYKIFWVFFGVKNMCIFMCGMCVYVYIHIYMKVCVHLHAHA